MKSLKQSLEDEARTKASLVHQVKNLNADLASLKDELGEEREAKAGLQKQVVRVSGECQSWRSRCEIEGVARSEETEEAKRKMAVRMNEADEMVSGLCTVVKYKFIFCSKN